LECCGDLVGEVLEACDDGVGEVGWVDWGGGEGLAGGGWGVGGVDCWGGCP